VETTSHGSNPYVESIKNFSRHRSLSKELHMLQGDDLVSKFKLIQAKNKKVSVKIIKKPEIKSKIDSSESESEEEKNYIKEHRISA
jgi:hypothetical protein